jgi:predicted alpha-1,6-mannanase (GH76 family)
MNNEITNDIKQDIQDIKEKVLKREQIPYNQGVLMGLEAALIFIDHHANEHKIRQLRKGNLTGTLEKDNQAS